MKKWQKVGLYWAIWMFVIMTFVWPYIDGEDITLRKTLIGIPVWLISGFAFGYVQRKNFKEKESN